MLAKAFMHGAAEATMLPLRRHKNRRLECREKSAPLFRQRLVAFDEGTKHIATVALRFASFSDVVTDFPQIIGTLVLIPAHLRALHRLQ